jgi:putative ATP-binding cassette transporter
VKKKAWFLLILSLALISLGIWVDVENSKIFGKFQENLAKKKIDEYYTSLYLLVGSNLVWLTVLCLSFFTRGYLSLFWREWMTNNFLNKFFSNLAFYDLQQKRNIDNPDQRITDPLWKERSVFSWKYSNPSLLR